MRNRKRLPLYTPGLISALLLPLLLLYFVGRYGHAHTHRALTFYALNPKWRNEPSMLSGKPIPPPRAYRRIDLTGDTASDRRKLVASQAQLRALLARNDTTTGLRYHFGGGAAYASFVGALNLCLVEEARTYVLLDDALWVYALPRATSKEPPFAFRCDSGYRGYEAPTFFERVEATLLPVWRQSGALLLGAAMLLFFSFRRIRRR